MTLNRCILKIMMLVSIISFSPLLFAINDFVGVYDCKGHDPYLNRDYSGTVTVTPQNTVYRLKMVYDTHEQYDATGGQYDNNLMSVVFQNKKDLKQVGLEQYRFEDDKKVMQGFWVYLGEDKLGKEVCYRRDK